MLWRLTSCAAWPAVHNTCRQNVADVFSVSATNVGQCKQVVMRQIEPSRESSLANSWSKEASIQRPHRRSEVEECYAFSYYHLALAGKYDRDYPKWFSFVEEWIHRSEKNVLQLYYQKTANILKTEKCKPNLVDSRPLWINLHRYVFRQRSSTTTYR